MSARRDADARAQLESLLDAPLEPLSAEELDAQLERLAVAKERLSTKLENATEQARRGALPREHADAIRRGCGAARRQIDGRLETLARVRAARHARDAQEQRARLERAQLDATHRLAAAHRDHAEALWDEMLRGERALLAAFTVANVHQLPMLARDYVARACAQVPGAYREAWNRQHEAHGEIAALSVEEVARILAPAPRKEIEHDRPEQDPGDDGQQLGAGLEARLAAARGGRPA